MSSLCSISNTTFNSNKRIRLRGTQSEVQSQAETEADPQETQTKLTLTNLYKSREDAKTEMVILNCKDGHVQAHKCVLVSGCDYFRAIFSQGSIENKENIIFLNDLPIEVVEIIIKFIYGQDVPSLSDISDAVLRETIISADKMLLKGLFDKYWVLYSTKITAEKLLDVWQLAQMFNQAETMADIRLFVLENMSELFEIDLSVTLMESIIAHDVEQLPLDKFSDFITFLLMWGTKGTNKMDSVLTLLSKCNISKLPAYYVWELMTNNQVVVNSKAIYNLLSKEASIRWLATVKPTVDIHVFEVKGKKCQYSCLSNAKWMPKRLLKNLHLIFPAISWTGAIFFYRFSGFFREFIAYDSSTRVKYSLVDQLNLLSFAITNETANYQEIYFRRSLLSYSCFNTDKLEWRVVDFNDEIKDSKYLILVNGQKYFFDVDERCVKIVDAQFGTCVTKEKPEGKWQGIKCKSLCRYSMGKLIFKEKGPNNYRLLIYDVESDRWDIVSVPNISGDVVMYACYDDDDCLIFEKKKYSFVVYSFKTMTAITEYAIAENFDGNVYFDVSFKM